MTIYLTRESSLAFMRLHAAQIARGDYPLMDFTTDASMTRSELRLARALTATPDAVKRPSVHALIGDRTRRHCRAEAFGHLWSTGNEALEGAFLRVNADLCVATPELCLMSMMSGIPMWERLRLATELVGSYSLAPWTERGFVDHQPLTTPCQIELFLQRLSGVRGSRQLKELLPFLLAGSASPLETTVILEFFLTSKLDGFGLHQAVSNARIDKEPDPLSAVGRSYYRVDLLWPSEKVVVEVDSHAFHASRSDLARDAAKRNALTQMGYVVITLSTGQIYDFAELCRVVRILRSQLGLPPESVSPELATRRLRLHDLLIRGEE